MPTAALIVGLAFHAALGPDPRCECTHVTARLLLMPEMHLHRKVQRTGLELFAGEPSRNQVYEATCTSSNDLH